MEEDKFCRNSTNAKAGNITNKTLLQLTFLEKSQLNFKFNWENVPIIIKLQNKHKTKLKNIYSTTVTAMEPQENDSQSYPQESENLPPKNRQYSRQCN